MFDHSWMSEWSFWSPLLLLKGERQLLSNWEFMGWVIEFGKIYLTRGVPIHRSMGRHNIFFWS